MKQLVYRIVAPWMRRLLHGKTGFKRISGTQSWLRYPKDQHLGFLLGREIHYEKNIRHSILNLVQPGSRVFEIGSNIGQYTLPLSERLGPTGRLIAIEPDHDNFSWLEINCRENHCHNVTLVSKAISDHVGEMKFYKDTVTGGRSGSLFEQYVGNAYSGKWETVLTMTYNQLVESYGIPDFVKVDAEGAEILIFNSITHLNPSTRYFIEVRDATGRAIYKLFTEAGFNVYEVKKDLKKIPDIEKIPSFANLLFINEQPESHRMGVV
ncbi:MAG TPA: FkbM family methyltransferase [Saprospiraceae bacterium]|nr:FkbM family methyltransferase [Saprospiraceae bacterium]